MPASKEDKLLRSVTLQNAQSILVARQKAERELIQTKEALARKAEELAEQREWAQVTLASIGDAVITTDTQGKINFLNSAAERLTGWRSSEALGLPLEKVFHVINEQTREPATSPIAKVLREGISVVLANHTSLIARDGTEISIEDSAAPIKDATGAIAGAVMVFYDVTERRRAEHALRRSEKLLSDFFENAAVGLHWVGPDGRILRANRAELDLLGYSEEEYVGHHIAEFHVDAAIIDDVLTKLSSGQALQNYEARLRCKDGSIKHVLISSNVLWEDGKFVHTRCFTRDITEQKRAQEALQKSEARKTAIVNAALDAIITIDHDGKIADFNPAAETIFGYRRHAAIGRPLAELLFPARLRHRDEELARYLTSGDGPLLGRRNELPALHADGHEFPAELSISRIPDIEPPLFTATLRDVTTTKQAQVIQARLAAIVESSDDGIIGKTLEGIVTSWNKGAERIFGYRAEEMIGKSITTVIPVDRHDEERFILSRLAQGAGVEHYETVRITKDGRSITVSLSSSPIRDAAGKIIGASKIVRDITERKRAEAALLDETRRLELLNKTGTTLSSNLDLQTLVQAATDAGTELSGAKFGAFFDRTIDQDRDAFVLYSLTGAPRVDFEKFGRARAMPILDATFKGGRPIRSDDVLQDPRYGKMELHLGMPPWYVTVRSFLAVPVVSRSGEIIGGLFFGHPEPRIFTERTERLIAGIAAQAAIAIDNARLYEAAQQAAEERKLLLDSERFARSAAERMSDIKDEFLATLSHELRTPLSAILGWSQVLKRGVQNEDDLRKGLDTIERNARAQTQLIEDLLDMSRITSGKVRLDIQPVAPLSFVEAAIETVRPAADAKGIKLEKLLDPAAGPISGDPNRLQQIVWNLLSNAIKFTPKGGRVQVLLERVDSQIEISVADTGAGIKPEFLTHVFERFRQADASTTRKYGGLGLGLSIVKHLVELHGGTVEARSAGEGLGATFVVQLPVTVVHRSMDLAGRHHPKTPPALSAHFQALDLSGVKVLMVDDEADARDLVKRILEECGAEVLTASTAADALLLVEKARPHVLVSDIGMPEVDGFEFLKQVRGLGQLRGGRLPAIALTAFARTEDRTRALHAGFLVHVSKPIEPSELVATVASVLGRTGDITIDRTH